MEPNTETTDNIGSTEKPSPAIEPGAETSQTFRDPQLESVTDGDDGDKLAEPVNELDNAAAAGVSANDIVAASTQPAPADPMDAELASIRIRLLQIEDDVKKHFECFERIFQHFGGKV